MDVSMSSCASSKESKGSKVAKKKFMQWAMKWYYANLSDEAQEKPDATLLVCLLQSIGFQLRHFEKITTSDTVSVDNKVTVTIECGTSRMQALLEMNDVHCRCPNPADADDASFWSVCGTEPTGSVDSINKLVASGSNLLPTVGKETNKMMNDVIYRLFNIINNTDVNQNNEDFNLSAFDNTVENISFTRGYTQPNLYSKYRNDSSSTGSRSTNLSSYDRRMSVSTQNLPTIITTEPSVEDNNLPTTLLRENTFDLETKSVDGEPRPSPPKVSSSPVIFTDLCTSLGQVSLQSDDGPSTIAGCLARARFYIDKAQLLDRGISPGASPRSSIGSDRDSVFRKPSVPSRSKLDSKSSPYSRKVASPLSLTVKPTVPPKSILRRSVGSPLASNQPINQATISKVSPATAQKPTLLRRKTIGEPSATLKMAVAGAQRKVIASKVDSNRRVSGRTSTSSSNSSLAANDTRTILAVKRRVSPEIKNTSSVSSSSTLSLKTVSTSASRTPKIVSPTGSSTTPKSTNSTLKLTTANSFIKKSTPNNLTKSFGYCKK